MNTPNQQKAANGTASSAVQFPGPVAPQPSNRIEPAVGAAVSPVVVPLIPANDKVNVPTVLTVVKAEAEAPVVAVNGADPIGKPQKSS